LTIRPGTNPRESLRRHRGLVIEKASGTTYEDYIEKRTLEPLGTRSM
jgi:hypothetical protein